MEEDIIDFFVSQSEGIQVHAPLLTGIDCAMYLGTPFLSNFRRHGSSYDEKSQKWGYFLLFKGIDYFYSFIHS